MSLPRTCNVLDIFIPNSNLFIDNYMELICPASVRFSEACNVKWTCDNGGNAVWTLTQFVTTNARYQCDDSDCCPWSDPNNQVQSTTIFKPLVNLITPDVSNATGEYYFFTSAATNRLISCGSNTCFIYCIVAQACVSATIYAGESDYLLLSCSETRSCDDAYITKGPTTKADIQCVSSSEACEQAVFILSDTNIINLECTGSITYDTGNCHYLQFWANRADIVSVNCNSAYSCRYMNFFVESVSTKTIISGNDTYALQYADFWTENSNSVRISCLQQSSCSDANILSVPYDTIYGLNILCSSELNACLNFEIFITNSSTFLDNFMSLDCTNQSRTGVCDIQYFCEDLNPSLSVPDTLMTFVSGESRYECNNQICCPWTNADNMETIQTTTLAPTPQPTNSHNVIFVDKYGNDSNIYCNNFTHACKTTEYAYTCFLGENGCNLKGYDGNGKINLGDGEWHWPVDFMYDDGELIINGNGIEYTSLYYDDTNASIGCVSEECWLQFNNLVLYAPIDEMNYDAKQINMYEGGTLVFEHVVFDGNNYNFNQNGDSMWTIQDEKVTVVFNNCIFKHNDAFYQILNKSNVQFTECVFEDNNATADILTSSDAMFDISMQAQLTFMDCIFKNNQQKSRLLFHAYNGAILNFINCTFENNSVQLTNLIDVSLNGTLSMEDCTFRNFNGYHTLITSDEASIYINNTYFQNNNNMFSLITATHGSRLEVTNSKFINNNMVTSLLNISDISVFDDTDTCSEADTASFVAISNIFTQNTANNLFYLHSLAAYIEDNSIVTDNIWNDFAILSVDSSISIDNKTIDPSQLKNTSNFIQFNHVMNNQNITICVHATNNIDISKYLLFDNNTNSTNTKVIFNPCLEQFSFSYPKTFLSRQEWLLSEQRFVYSISGQSVSDTLICNDSIQSCSWLCNNSVSCFDCTFLVQAPITNIICDADFACAQSKINASSQTSSIATLSVICDKKESCSQCSIVINSVNEFTLECFESLSCEQLTIDITNSTSSTIICYKSEACNSLKITTDNDNTTTLIMHEYSSNIQFNTVSGYNGQNLDCNPSDAYIIIDNEFNSMQESTLNLFSNNFPCSDITFTCNETQYECEMTYIEKYNSADIDTFQDFFICYGPVFIDEILDIRCRGACIDGPTMEPTVDPTSSPTDITTAPSPSPIQSPTSATFTPTFSPTVSPTLIPTEAPSISPTIPPTQNPSTSPSDAPSVSPSISPTVAPTVSPTHNPISNSDFDSFIQIIYKLSELNSTDIVQIATNAITESFYISSIIKDAYFFQGILDYKNFLVSIAEIEHTQINEINENSRIEWSGLNELLLTSNIECNQFESGVNYCASIQHQSQANSINNFDKKVTNKLSNYYNNAKLIFSVENPESLVAECKYCNENKKEPVDYALYILAGVIGLTFISSICAFLYNKNKFPSLPGFNAVDNAKWAYLGLLGIQLWDFFSDIFLSIEIWSRSDVFENRTILISAIGCIIFIVLPYITNLYIASKIKQYNIIKNNFVAISWFENYAVVFALIVVFTGGCHVALSLFSSCVFGLSIMTSGLTNYELKKLNKIKIFGSTLLENVPQVIIQIIYSLSIGTPSTAVQLSFTSSILSIITTTLSYLIERDNMECKVVQYYLCIKCTQRSNNKIINDDSEEEEMKEMKSFTTSGEVIQTSPTIITITDNERSKFINNRGKKEKLGVRLAEVYGIPSKNIEIGYSNINKYGCVIHIVQYVHHQDLEMMEEELIANNSNIASSGITAKFFVEQLFLSLSRDVNQAFRTHFGISKDFEVTFQHRYGYQKQYKNDNNNEENKQSQIPRVVRRIVSQIEMSNIENNEIKTKSALNKLFNEKGIKSKTDKINMVTKLIGEDDNEIKEEYSNDNNVDDLLMDDLNDNMLQMTYKTLKNDDETMPSDMNEGNQTNQTTV